MSDCAKIQELISAMLDGELSERECAAIEAHIKLCPQCAAMYADFAALSGSMGEICSQVPASLHDKIMKGVRTSPKPKKSVLISLRPYMSAAACLVVVIGAVLAFRGGGFKMAASDSAASVPASMPAAAAEVYSMEAADQAVCEETEADYGSKYTYDMPAEKEMPAAEEPAAPAPDAPAGEPAEDAKNEAAEEEPADDLSRDMPLYGYAAYEPGTAIDEAWYIHYSSGEDFPQMQRILFPELLRELLAPSEKETGLDSLPSDADAIVRLRCGGEYTTIKLHFTDGLILVETSGGLYTAVGSPEEFLSINDYTIG